MAGGSRFSNEQIEKIRKTLQGSLGDESSQVLQSLESRLSIGEGPEISLNASDDEDESGGKKVRAPGSINVGRIIEENKVEKMLEALPQVKENHQAVRMLVTAVLQHPESKAFHMVEALGKVKGEVELVNALCKGIISRKGVNPLIEALRHATASQEAMKMLAYAVAEQGTVAHMIRAIATVHKNQELEMIWAMEIMAKGGVDQMLEAINLMDKASPGIVILATGVVSNKEVAISQLVSALQNCKDNPKAASIIAVELARRADISSLVTLLEKYVSDDSDAGEIVVCKLVEKGRPPQMVQAVRSISSNSMAGRILAAGIIQGGQAELVERAYKTMSTSAPGAKQMLALDLIKKKGKFNALRILGKEVLDLLKNQEEIEGFGKKAVKRMEWVLKSVDANESTAGGG
ncbi:MAG: hypothetical protein HQL51_12005 [Magnetococcales bacterium]|nr:hypothetical protein [Magnetococcales bacterium]